MRFRALYIKESCFLLLLHPPRAVSFKYALNWPANFSLQAREALLLRLHLAKQQSIHMNIKISAPMNMKPVIDKLRTLSSLSISSNWVYCNASMSTWARGSAHLLITSNWTAISKLASAFSFILLADVIIIEPTTSQQKCVQQTKVPPVSDMNFSSLPPDPKMPPQQEQQSAMLNKTTIVSPLLPIVTWSSVNSSWI